MRDATVTAVAGKLFKVCGPSWVEDSYMHWSAVVKAWAVGATRSLHDEDRQAVIYAIQALDEAEMERRRVIEAEEDAAAELAAIEELQGALWVRHSWDRGRDCLVTERVTGRRPTEPGWYRQGSIDEIEARENAGQKELFA
ncbi:hypothetical protein ACQKKX_04900 [Neorhizobium sp. NPDC001467]|uniref:hypothetical protein n=1 Tax=Neorhizobium sp. NPDC001467 TaxID=3390595 RepID=UPI003D08152B